MAINWTKVPANVRSDVVGYVRDNNLGLGSLEEMDPKMAFHYWLQWNGLVGWTESILQAGETLGVFVVRR